MPGELTIAERMWAIARGSQIEDDDPALNALNTAIGIGENLQQRLQRSELLLSSLIDVCHGLADQQAMADDSWRPAVKEAEEFLSKTP